MTLESLRTTCMSFPDATEQIQWGKDLVFKVGGKMFCVACTEPVEPPKVAMSFKCDDETFAALIEREGAVPAPYMAQHKWVALEQFDTLPDVELKPLLARAYEIVSAKLPKSPSTRAKPAAKKRASRSLRTGAPRSGRAPGRPARSGPAAGSRARSPRRRRTSKR
jgi:predicted DNA-binding protein (MmcQ/YjbR family)